MKHVGINLDAEKLAKLVEGNDKQVTSLIDKLFEIDSIPIAKSTRSETVTDSRLSIVVGEIPNKKPSVTR